MKPTLRINGASIFGVRPGHPFLYTIPASGPSPRRYGAKGLPNGLELDPWSGQIRGLLRSKGRWKATLLVESGGLRAGKAFTIVCGEEICLTPPLGWNSWNCWAHEVSQEKVLASARAMAAGLKDYGWSYVNIDDTWQGQRDARGVLQPNAKFPDMGGLCRDIHALGLKVGIYSTPWLISYAGYLGGSAERKGKSSWRKRPWPAYTKDQRIGRFQFDELDAKQWAEWGIDYLKYDWHVNDVPSTRRMQRALRRSGRDIVLSLSNTAPLDRVAELSRWANCWRTTGDIRDDGRPGHLWERGSLTIGNFHGVLDIWRYHHLFRAQQRPGHYNDADMLVLGSIGWGDPKPTSLTRHEQLSHISLWSLFGSPLLLGCPLDKMDAWTRSLVTNEELLEVHQDSLGAQAAPAFQAMKPDMPEAWVKPLEDGALAVGLFNPHNKFPVRVGVSWDELGIKGRRKVRDLWLRRDLGWQKGGVSAMVPAHGVKLLKLA